MSAWSTIHVLPAEDFAWIPDRQQIERIPAHIDATRATGMFAYSVPYDYFGTEDPEESVLFERYGWEASVSEALDLCETFGAVTAFIEVETPAWSESLCVSLDSVSFEVTDSFVPDETSIKLGPFSIPSPAHDRSIGNYSFGLRFGGQGMPLDWDAYLDYVEKATVILELLGFLEKETGKRWRLLFSSSC